MTSRLTQTPSQTVGPFFSIGLVRPGGNLLVRDATRADRIRLEGTVFDGAGQPVKDALLEIWQADERGIYRDRPVPGAPGDDAEFTGFGRCGTDDGGAFQFHTIKPGAVGQPDGRRFAPHINVIVFARGMLSHLFTRVYFGDDPLESDPVLRTVEGARSSTLVAQLVGAVPERVYRWDIHLQGDRETVFFDA